MQQNIKNIVNRISTWYKGLPDKKRHIEFITALLSVPVMLTVIILNLNNLNQQKNTAQKQTTTENISPIQIVIKDEKSSEKSEHPPTSISPTTNEPTATPNPTPNASCIKEVGSISILSPRDSEVVTSDPVCITISTQSGYCPVIWSYKFNDDAWSDYSDKNICLHNMTNGNKTIQLKIKSTTSNDEITLQRSFVYQGNTEPSATSIPATSSASLN